MPFKLLFTQEVASQLKVLERDKGLQKRLKAVRKALAYLETNPRHQGLNTQALESLTKMAIFASCRDSYLAISMAEKNTFARNLELQRLTIRKVFRRSLKEHFPCTWLWV